MRINRLVETIMLLVNKKNITVKYLSEYFKVSRKTIYGDLDILLTSGIPINYGDNNKGLVTILSSFDFHKKFISKEERPDEIQNYDYYQKYKNNDQYLNYTKEMWDNFINKRSDGLKDLDASVFHSWMRSQAYKVPIYTIDADNLVKAEDISKYDLCLLTEDKDVKLFCDLMAAVGWYVSIYTPECKLKYIINRVQEYDRIFPRLGYSIDVNESKLGTNAIAVSLLEERLTLIYGTQHYNKLYHEISSISTPIYKDGKLYAAFNVTFIHTDINPDVQMLVKAVARLYEKLVLKNFERDPGVEHILMGKGDKFYEKDKTELMGASKLWYDLMMLADSLSVIEQDFMIIGERGGGKESLGRYIHENSIRKFAPCLTVDFLGMGLNKQKALMFGSENHLDEPGLMEAAHGGSLIIKHPEAMHEDLKKRWINCLSHKKIKRIGSKTWKTFDVRLILCFEANTGHANADISSALPLATLSIPPIKRREEDSEAIILAMMKETFKRKKMTKAAITNFVHHAQNHHLNESVGGLKKYLLNKIDCVT